MHSSDSRIVADGPRRLRDAGNYAGERRRILRELGRKHEAELGRISVWRRWWLQLKLRRMARPELNGKFPPTALYVCASGSFPGIRFPGTIGVPTAMGSVRTGRPRSQEDL